jgi:hypothetical protein
MIEQQSDCRKEDGFKQGDPPNELRNEPKGKDERVEITHTRCELTCEGICVCVDLSLFFSPCARLEGGAMIAFAWLRCQRSNVRFFRLDRPLPPPRVLLPIAYTDIRTYIHTYANKHTHTLYRVSVWVDTPTVNQAPASTHTHAYTHTYTSTYVNRKTEPLTFVSRFAWSRRNRTALHRTRPRKDSVRL